MQAHRNVRILPFSASYFWFFDSCEISGLKSSKTENICISNVGGEKKKTTFCIPSRDN